MGSVVPRTPSPIHRSESLGPENMTLFGNRVVADVVKMRSLGSALIQQD